MPLIPLPPGVTPNITPVSTIVPIRPPVEEVITVSPAIMFATVFIIGTIFLLLLAGILLIMVFGQPMRTAQKANSGGQSIIQHFNTPRSAFMKLAKVAGGGFQYFNIRDGTAAAIPDSVYNIGGRQLVLTFENLGITIPIKILGAISLLVHGGISDFKELTEKKCDVVMKSKDIYNPATGETVNIPYTELKPKDETILKGYDFEQFKTLLGQAKEESLIPLVIEAMPNFVTRNINVDSTEKKITINGILGTNDIKDNSRSTFLMFVIGIAILLIISMVVK
jgi:hypothetical protein